MENFINSNLILILLLIGIFGGILLAFNIFIFLKIKRINKKSEIFFSGKRGKDLESVINSQNKDIRNLDKEIEELFKASEEIYKLSFKGIHKVGVVRFNPFKDIGGNQSFSISLLNGDNSGLVLSSLHTREGTRIFSKPIIKGKSEKFPLTKEEEQVIKESQIEKKL